MSTETKTCPRCWELSPATAKECSACRHLFDAPPPRPKEKPPRPGVVRVALRRLLRRDAL